MAEVTKARTGKLLLMLFGILSAQPDGMKARDALAALIEQIEMTPYEAGDYPTGGRRFEKIVRFATVDTVKAGWLVKDKGVWTVTPEGAQAARSHGDEQFYREAVRLYQKWKKAQPVLEIDEDDDAVVEKSATITLEQAEEMAWAEIMCICLKCRPTIFKNWWRPCSRQWVTTSCGLRRRARMAAWTSLLTTTRWGYAPAANQGAGQTQCRFAQNRRDGPAQFHGGAG